MNIHENVETWVRLPHIATAYVQNMLWWDETWFLKTTTGRVSTVKSKAVNVRTVCLWQAIAANTSEIQLPHLEPFRTYLYDSNVSVPVEPGILSQDNVSFTDFDQVRTLWIEKAQAVDALTAGLVVLAPLSKPNDTLRSALGCSIDARWDESHLVEVRRAYNASNFCRCNWSKTR